MASSSDATASTNERPEGPEASGRRGRVRLKRAAVMAVPATAVAAA